MTRTIHILAFLILTVLASWFAATLARQEQALPEDDNAHTLYRVFKDGKWGFADKSGNIIIKPQYDGVEPFSDGLAALYSECIGYQFFTDAEGDLLDVRNFRLLASLRFSEGLLAVEKDFKYGYIDKTGKIAIPLQFDGAGDFAEGLAPVLVKDKWGYVDRTGKILIKPQFADAASFSEGFAAITFDEYKSKGEPQSAKVSGRSLEVEEENQKWGYINKAGEVIIAPQYNFVGSFSNGLAPVGMGKRVYLTNENAPPDQKWGYINNTGKVVIRRRFNSAKEFAEGVAAVRVGIKWGYINAAGKFVILPKFEEAESFKGGLAQVATGVPKIFESSCGVSTKYGVEIVGRHGYIDKSGNFVSQKLTWKVK